MRNTHLKTILLSLAVLLFAAAAALAQTISGSLAGLVTDIKGAAIPGAQVQITSLSRREVKTSQTDQDGRFVFPQLAPDIYQMQVEAKGFKGFKIENLILNANDKISAPEITLEPGAVSESVTVIASNEQLQTESAERGGAI